MSKLEAAWQQLGEQTVAGLTSTPPDQLTDVLIDVAARLTATGSPASEPAPLSRDIV